MREVLVPLARERRDDSRCMTVEKKVLRFCEIISETRAHAEPPPLEVPVGRGGRILTVTSDSTGAVVGPG